MVNAPKWSHSMFLPCKLCIPAGIYLLKDNLRNTRTRCEICSKLTVKTPERRHWRHSGVFIVNFEHISHLALVFLLLLTLNAGWACSYVCSYLVFNYELGGCGFESRYGHILKFLQHLLQDF